MPKIHYRNFQKSDEAIIAKIINDTWQFSHYSNPETGMLAAKIYLLGSLAEATFQQVCELDGEPVGIILCRSNRKRKDKLVNWVKYTLPMIATGFRYMGARDNRLLSEMDGNVSKTTHGLLQKSGLDFDGELVFFAVNEKTRGLGIGKELYQRGVTYLKEAGVNRFYLFTDTRCNYGFYDHMGMTQVGEDQLVLKEGEEPTIFYLYSS